MHFLSTKEVRRALQLMERYHLDRADAVSKAEALVLRGKNNPALASDLAGQRVAHYGWAHVCETLRAFLAEQPRVLAFKDKPPARVKPNAARDSFLSMAGLRATCRECQQPLDQVAACTCIVRPAAKPLRKAKIENPKSKIARVTKGVRA